MKKRLLWIIALTLIMALALCGCGNKSEKQAEADVSEETVTEETASVVTTFDEIDTEGMSEEPLQLESVTLYDDGSVSVVPTDDVKKIAETNNELKDGAAHPFEEIGKVKEIYLVKFGDAGYRTVIALMDDNSLSALSAKDLIEEHILVVMPNVSNRDDYASVEQRTSEDYYGEEVHTVVGITEEGDEIELDFSLDF